MIFSDILAGVRYAAETRGADGRATRGATTPLTGIRASVQRPTGRALARLAEGGHTADAWLVDTRTLLRTLDETQGLPADELTIDNLTYVVFEVAQVRGVLPHYEVLVIRQEEGRQP